MRNLYKLTLGLLLPAYALSAGATQYERPKSIPDLSSFTYKAKGNPSLFGGERMRKINHANLLLEGNGKSKKVSGKADAQLPASTQFDYLDAPNGEIWYYTTTFVTEDKVISEYYSEKIIKEYQFDIYDTNLNKIGEVKDKVELIGDEVKPASVTLAGAVTRKFFNTDDKYEVVVTMITNKPDYSTGCRSYVYSIGGEKTDEGNDKVVSVIDGNLVDVIDASPNKWSETFYLSFMSESMGNVDDYIDDYEGFLDSYKVKIDTYSKSTYSGGISKAMTVELPYRRIAGDQMSAPFFFTFMHDGQVNVCVSEYENNFYLPLENPDDWTQDQQQNPDNNLIINLYKLTGANAECYQTTKIPVVKNSEAGAYYSYFSIGNLTYRNDVNFEDYGNAGTGKAAFIITQEDYYLNNDDNYYKTYYVYDAEGKLIKKLAQDVETAIALSDIRGQEPQYMFARITESGYIFDFVNLISGELVTTLRQSIPSPDGFEESLTANIDRYPVGDSYQYACELRVPGLDDNGNDILRVAWIDTEGKMVSIDEINMGKNINLAQSYIAQATLDPCVMNTDNIREYLILVKRGNVNEGALSEELLIAQPKSQTHPDGNVILEIRPDARGVLSTIIPMVEPDGGQLIVVLYNQSENKYYQDFYSLPLNKYNGGDGSEENPYMIATIGDLRQIGKYPSANYKVVADIDAANTVVKPQCSETVPFTGVIDGDNHVISNLTIGGENNAGLFNSTLNATIKDLTFINATVEMNGDGAGSLISAIASRTKVDNVHVYGLKVNGSENCNFGGIICRASLYTEVKNSSVSNLDINLPKAQSVGGIYGDMRTSTKAVACAVNGSIHANNEVGGITGCTTSGDESISDCHVDVNIKGNYAIGGIAGVSARSVISRCYVEGSLESLSERPWGGGAKMGGIVGSLEPLQLSQGAVTDPSTVTPVILNNFVRLESMTVAPYTKEPSYEGQNETVHRIVGETCINEGPQIDYDNTIDEDNPVYLPTREEYGMKNNYAIVTLPRFGAVTADASTTEGADVDAADLNGEFYAGLGFKYGNTTDAPWSDATSSDPSLYHETSLRAISTNYDEIAGNVFDAELVVVSRQQIDLESFISDFTCNIADESVVAMTGNGNIVDNKALIEFEALKEGVTSISCNWQGSEVILNVKVSPKPSAIEDIEESTFSLTLANGFVKAPGAEITLYNLQGARIVTASDVINVSDLESGIYIAVARNDEGKSARLKFVK